MALQTLGTTGEKVLGGGEEVGPVARVERDARELRRTCFRKLLLQHKHRSYF